MGLAGFLRSLFSSAPPAIRRDDRIWLTQGAKLRGIVRDVERSLSEGVSCLIVAHFPNMLRGMQTLLEGTGRPFEVLTPENRPGDWTERLIRGPERLRLTESKHLPEAGAAAEPIHDETKTVAIVVVESHPLPSLDEAIERFARQLPCRSRLQIHLSLEDAVMRAFAGEWVRDMLRRLGMKEDEAIESRLVMKQVRAAQRKFEARTIGDQPADSAEEWLRLNCPQLAPSS